MRQLFGWLRLACIMVFTQDYLLSMVHCRLSGSNWYRSFRQSATFLRFESERSHIRDVSVVRERKHTTTRDEAWCRTPPT